LYDRKIYEHETAEEDTRPERRIKANFKIKKILKEAR
jgi:acyl-CoA oxidase